MRFPAALLAGAMVFAAPVGAAGSGTLETRVSIRTMGAGFVQRESCPPASAGDSAGGLSRTLLRVEFSGRPVSFMAGEVHVVGGADFASAAESVPGLSAAGALRHRVLDEEWEWLDSSDASGRLGFDRLNVLISASFADITIGRQAVNFSKAYFWNPLDVFLAFDPRQFDREYKPGVDAARLDLALGRFAGLNVVWAGGREIAEDGGYARGGNRPGGSWYGSALIGRAYGALYGWDTAVQAGKVYGGIQLGFGFSGEAGPLEVRGEAAWLDVLPADTVFLASGSGPLLEDNLQAVLGLGRRLTDRITVEGEYFFNGAASRMRMDLNLVRMASGHSLHLGRHLAGLQGAFEIQPLLTVSLAWMGGLEDSSGLIQPGIVYSLGDEAEFLAGAQLNYGRAPGAGPGFTILPRSEFGSYPHALYAELKFYL